MGDGVPSGPGRTATLGITNEVVRVAERLNEESNLPIFALRYMVEPIDKTKFPEHSLPATAVQRLIRNTRQLDATPRLNLASFVTTWMEPECDELMHEARAVNYIDESEYPSCTKIQNNCVAMLADLFHAEGVCGTSTVGSSEAILLGGIAMKRRWSEKRKAEGKPLAQCNMVCGSEVHVVWQKLFNYLEIEPRYVNITEEVFLPKPEDIAAACDENTIGVVGILGTTYSGQFEDIAGLDKAIGEVNEKNGWDIAIHVDGASGGFVVPFLFPDLEFDFRLKNVVSINVSGHKYGLTYPGIGWCIFRSRAFLPESLVFHDNYLGTDQINFTLNFSKGASQIIGQFYQFLRLGRIGYTAVMQNCWYLSQYLADRLEKTGYFRILSARAPNPGLPTVVFNLLPEKRNKGYDEFIIADHLRQRNWVVPAYSMAPNATDVKVLRVLCREDLGISGATQFADDVEMTIEWLNSHPFQTPEQVQVLRTAAKWAAARHRDVDAATIKQIPDDGTGKAHGGIC